MMTICKKIIASFSVEPDKGMPLGNLTSQLFANIYLNELDRYVKHELREPFYLRYCDDFILLHHSKRHLESLVPLVSAALNDRLKLCLHPKKVTIRTWHQGIDWLGYVVMPNATVIRSKTKRRMIERVNENNLSSYLGMCGHADSFELEQLLQTKASSEP